MKRYGKVHVDDEMVLASIQAHGGEDEAFMTQMRRLGTEISRKLFGDPKPKLRTSRRIRRNALRELKRRLRWGKGAGKITEWKADGKGKLVPIRRQARSFAESLRTMDVARVAADKRIGEPEMALLYAAQGWRP